MFIHLVQLVHLMGILFMITIPFQNEVNLLVLHVSASMSIFTHWFANDNTCFLSLVEAKLRGIPKDHGFIHSLVAPIYDMNKKQTTMMTYVILLCLMGLSLYKIATSKRFEETCALYAKTKELKSFLLLLAPSNERSINKSPI